jgi:hypothetical protein
MAQSYDVCCLRHASRDEPPLCEHPVIDRAGHTSRAGACQPRDNLSHRRRDECVQLVQSFAEHFGQSLDRSETAAAALRPIPALVTPQPNTQRHERGEGEHDRQSGGIPRFSMVKWSNGSMVQWFNMVKRFIDIRSDPA